VTISIKPFGYLTFQVGADDISRATDAAEDVFVASGVTPEAAYTAYKAQWLEFEDEDYMNGDALLWVAARKAADRAITDGWDNPNAEIFCDMEA
jgi:hypothetical protein